jgi:glycosyltransferase involved in cell wall biosynthesis
MFTIEPLPKISCLMITASGRLDFAKRSIRCFVDQTYPNKELIVVNEGPVDYQHQLEAELSGLAARTIWLKGSYTLGELRNISIYAASGDIICQWDDDDFCYPTRLFAQYSRMRRVNAAASFLTNQLHYYFHNSRLYWDNWKKYGSGGQFHSSLIPGTIMIYRHLPFRYPERGESCRAGEDTVLLNDLVRGVQKSKVLQINDIGWMHVYSQHGCNQVYDYSHHFEISNMRSNSLEYILRCRTDIETALNYFKFGNVKVMSREGVAFEHEAS